MHTFIFIGCRQRQMNATADTSLGGGAIAGIVLGCLLFLGAIGAVLYVFCCRKRKGNKTVDFSIPKVISNKLNRLKKQ